MSDKPKEINKFKKPKDIPDDVYDALTGAPENSKFKMLEDGSIIMNGVMYVPDNE